MQKPYTLIKGYSVSYYGGAKNVNNYPYRAVIHLFEKKSSGYLGCAYFHRSPDTMPDTDKQEVNGRVELHFLTEHFPMVLDLLRNEEPIHLSFMDEKWNIGGFNTAREPVGEGEPS